MSLLPVKSIPTVIILNVKCLTFNPKVFLLEHRTRTANKCTLYMCMLPFLRVFITKFIFIAKYCVKEYAQAMVFNRSPEGKQLNCLLNSRTL